MKALDLTIAIVLALPVLGAGYPVADAEGSLWARPRLGMNLAGPADWNTELPFVDVFRLSRRWISQRRGASWGQGPELALDAQGWVTGLEPDCWADTPLCTIKGGHYPSGKYTVLYDGEGKIEFWGAAVAVSQRPGLMVVDVDADKGGFFLKITETNPSNYVRNIRVIMPGFDESYKDDPFHLAFLERWRGMACLRFMDWTKTNGSGIEKWSERPKPDDATFTSRGVPLEVMIDLCNRLKADAWFCMPHRADDDYVRNFSLMVRDKLDPDLRVYVEYSNEVWNTMFPQTRYSWERGAKLGIGPKERPWEGGGKYYAQRSVDIFRIWEDVFGGRERLVRVLAWQAANTWWMENIVLTHQDAYKQADALGVAPYLGMSVPLKGEGLVAGEVAGWTVDRALDHLDRHSLPEATEAIRACKSVADRFGLTLIAYEGGQHMVGVGGAEDNQAMTDLFHRANSHPRMGAIYRKYFDAWRSAGGDLFCHFSSVGKWSKWGSWGAMRYYDDDPREAPKLMAIMDWAKSCGQNVAAPSAE